MKPSESRGGARERIDWKFLDHFSVNLRAMWRDDGYQNDPLLSVHLLTVANFGNRKYFRFNLKFIFQFVIYVIQDNSDDERLYHLEF